jgi:LysR family glycine cleavage system transcriptional activator
LPPLNALRAFEAAARHLSFAQAAKELHVTPAAISHQVKGLEEDLAVKLFRRQARGLELTSAGRVCLPKLSEGFDRLAEAVEKVRSSNAPGTLSVSAAPTFASKWLAPRLHRFVTALPNLDLRLNASTRLIDATKDEGPSGEAQLGSLMEDADIAIRFGSGRYPEFRVDKLFPVSVTPMCSPRLLAGEQPLREPADLRHHVLIHDNIGSDDGRPMWQVWLEAAGVEGVDITHGLRFNHAVLALEAAADGLGVALGMPQIAALDLASGRLAAPFALRLPIASAYYLVCAGDRCDRSDVVAFRDWILQEAGRDSAAGAPR